MFMQLIGRLFNRNRETSSRSAVKQRLQLVIAHDRAALSPATIESMQKEILAVVSRYVEIDTDKLNFSLKSNDRMTSLTADLPIRRIRKTPLELEATATETGEAAAAKDEVLFNETIAFDFELEDQPGDQADEMPVSSESVQENPGDEGDSIDN
jgi:cell division topological specificity factor